LGGTPEREQGELRTYFKFRHDLLGPYRITQE
jgi:hypothetical protein